MQTSTNLAGCSYDDQRRVLTIEFNSGGTYEYMSVPREVFEGLDTSPSPGGYFARQIRDRFQTIKVA